jgi:hypothetical protein
MITRSWIRQRFARTPSTARTGRPRRFRPALEALEDRATPSTTGTVVAWGENYNGSTTVPAGLSGVTEVAAGYDFSLALKSDGTVVAWGSNGFGQTSVPAGLSGVTEVTGGAYHSLAIAAAADPAHSLVTVSPSSVTYGNKATVTLQVKDSSGANLSSGGLSVAFALGAGTSGGTLGPVTDNGNGTYTATFTATAVGSPRTITATLNGAPVTTTLPTVTVTPAPITVLSVQVNDGSAQRSMVTSLTVTFSQQITTLDPGAFEIDSGTTQLVPTASDLTISDNQVVIRFTGLAGVVAGSLADGRHTLIEHQDKIQGGGGNYALLADHSDRFFRLFGDVNGDGKVDNTDRTAFLAAYRSRKGMANYRLYFDVNNDGVIDSTDYYQFLARYGTTLPS